MFKPELKQTNYSDTQDCISCLLRFKYDLAKKVEGPLMVHKS